MNALVDDAFVKAVRRVAADLPTLTDHKPAAAQPKWWRLTLTLHQGVTVIRNVIVKPDAHSVLESGWFETAANGDEFAVGYDSIATVSINGFSGPMPESPL